MRPPRLAERLLDRALARCPHGNEIVGDLEEDFQRRHRRGGTSRWAAPFWYCLQAALLAWRLPRTSRNLRTHDLPRSELTMYRWIRDTRYALGALRRSPGLVLTVVLTFGLGIGANIAIFSVVNGVLLTPLGFEDSSRVVAIWGASLESSRRPLPAGDFEDIRQRADLLEVTGHWSDSASLTGEHDPVEVTVGWVDVNYFDVLRISALHGRLLAAHDEQSLLLGHEIWRRLYGGDPGIVGQSVLLAGVSFEVVGILPPAPNPNVPSISGDMGAQEVWRLMPTGWYEGSDDRELGWLRLNARLRDDVTIEQARQQLDQIAAAARPPENGDDRPRYWYEVTPALDALVGAVRPTLVALSGAVGFVLLIAALNVAQLLLTRGRGRAAELAVRSALGAGRSDLVRQLVIEAAVLTTIGGVAGALIGGAGVRALLAIAPANLPRLDSISLNTHVALFALAVTALTALVAGIVPALASTRSPGTVLRAQSSTPGRRFRRMSAALVICEVAMSLVLLTGAGLLARSFMGLMAEQPGFEPEQLLTLSITAAGDTGPDRPNPFTPIRRELETIPGVIAVGGTNRLPLGGGLFTGNYATETMGEEAEDKPAVDFRWVTPGFFRAMGTRLVTGRLLVDEDGEDKILVDRQLAEDAWPGEDPLGRQLWTGNLGRNGEWSEVIGVVEPMKHTSVAAGAVPTVFFHAISPPSSRVYFAVRTQGAPQALSAAVLEHVERAAPGATVSQVRTMQALVADANAPWRFALGLMAIFAGVAMSITVVGLYGVVAYSVAQRTQEFGIRVALGASAPSVVRLVLGHTMLTVATGTILGAFGAAALSGLIANLLHNVGGTDPATYAAVVSFMILAGLVGAWRPTRRALRVSPRVALGEK